LRGDFASNCSKDYLIWIAQSTPSMPEKVMPTVKRIVDLQKEEQRHLSIEFNDTLGIGSEVL
jgi:hypothetical protein